MRQISRPQFRESPICVDPLVCRAEIRQRESASSHFSRITTRITGRRELTLIQKPLATAAPVHAMVRQLRYRVVDAASFLWP
ncbi:hypothetical protein Poly51_49120 [Rubripirellula tenax]|uniref:Uncharacterized protein n=1 Tax=Rubripirellula tenax TaxID=2528015 RepID=A0A5C6EJM4_9BACT|nr:hypothetical protein Poly51_49120 [Rubripirellula tenax]